MALEGKKTTFWNKINSQKYYEIPVDLNIEDTPSQLTLYNSKKYYKGALWLMTSMYLLMFFILLFQKYLMHKEVDILPIFHPGALIFFGISLTCIIPMLDKRPKVIINTMGIETRNDYISWRDVRNIYLEKSESIGYGLIKRLIIIKDYEEKVELELTGIQGSFEDTATIIGVFYSNYLKMSQKKITKPPFSNSQ